MKIVIREPKESEYNQVVEVVNSELNLYKKFFTKEEIEGIGIGDFDITDLKDTKSRNQLVAVADEKILGFASWYAKPNNVAWISMLEISPDEQKQGIGSKLIAEIEKLAKQQKNKAIALETQRKAFWAVDFYKKNNYKILSEEALLKEPFKDTLPNPPVKNTYIFGKVF